MAFELGRTYSVYEFLDVLRTSRSTAAYRVRNRLARREEQLQVLLESAQDDQEQVERFMREIAVRASLVHPNIVTFYTAFVLEGRLVMTTELVDGPTVAQLLEAGPFEWREAVAIARQALSALACAHRRNVVHRDISPQNIVLANGAAKLANFTLAKSASSPQLTLAGAIVGNPRYISPEQVRGTGELDARSDIYSLGAVFYEMLCGSPPFDSRSQFEMMLAHVNGAVKPPSELRATVPAALDAILLKALAKHPAERYQTAEEFMDALPPGEPAFALPPQLLLAPPPEPPESPAQPQPELRSALAPKLPAAPGQNGCGPGRSESAAAPQPEPVRGFAWPWESEEVAPARPEPALASAPELAGELPAQSECSWVFEAAMAELAAAPPESVCPSDSEAGKQLQPEPASALAAAVAAEPETELPPPGDAWLCRSGATAEPQTEPAGPQLALAPPPGAPETGQSEAGEQSQPEPTSAVAPALTAEPQTEPAEPQLALAPPPGAAEPRQSEATPPSESQAGAQSQPEPGPEIAAESDSQPVAPQPALAAPLELAWPWQSQPVAQPQPALAFSSGLAVEPDTPPFEQPALEPPPGAARPWQVEAETPADPAPHEPASPPQPESPFASPPPALAVIPANGSERNGTPLAPPPPVAEPLVPPPPPSPPLGWAIVGGAAAGAAAVFLAIWIFT